MAKYRKKPITVEAEIYQKGMEDGFQPCSSATCQVFHSFDKKCRDCDLSKPYIETLEGNMYISEGDYIIIGVKGERYPCKPDIFEMTYELVEN